MGEFPSGGGLREIVLEVDIPDVLAELVATFEAYERALTGNDIETLNSLFWDSPSTVRYGTREAERQYGHEEIAAFRIQRGGWSIRAGL